MDETERRVEEVIEWKDLVKENTSLVEVFCQNSKFWLKNRVWEKTMKLGPRKGTTPKMLGEGRSRFQP